MQPSFGLSSPSEIVSTRLVRTSKVRTNNFGLGKWQSWGACTASCSPSGIQVRTRQCRGTGDICHQIRDCLGLPICGNFRENDTHLRDAKKFVHTLVGFSHQVHIWTIRWVSISYGRHFLHFFCLPSPRSLRRTTRVPLSNYNTIDFSVSKMSSKPLV